MLGLPFGMNFTQPARFATGVVVVLLLLTAALHLLPRLGKAGRQIAGSLQTAPGLDLLVTIFTVLPWGIGGLLWGWRGLIAGVLAQMLAMHLWVFFHEWACRKSTRGPRILKVLNAAVGPARNYTAVWITALAVPIFWAVRVAEWVIYPPLVVLVRFPSYKQSEWVNVSRHKFEGLVGWDLIWCLYCDWMTGIWSMGTDMLRNVESFWCPIRFDSDKKCENCKTDFPDICGGWIAADGNIADVARLLEKKYPREAKHRFGWFNHPARQSNVSPDVPVPGSSGN